MSSIFIKNSQRIHITVNQISKWKIKKIYPGVMKESRDKSQRFYRLSNASLLCKKMIDNHKVLRVRRPSKMLGVVWLPQSKSKRFFKPKLSLLRDVRKWRFKRYWLVKENTLRNKWLLHTVAYFDSIKSMSLYWAEN